MKLALNNILFTFIVPGTVAVYVPWFAFNHSPVGFSTNAIAGVVMLIAGTAIYIWCVWDFATAGRGIPLPIDAPRKLVVRGLYTRIRNPMYVGVLTVLLGWTFLLRSMQIGIYTGCVWFAFHLFVVLYEEPHLKKVFGLGYEDYCAKVRRWLPIRRQV